MGVTGEVLGFMPEPFEYSDTAVRGFDTLGRMQPDSASSNGNRNGNRNIDSVRSAHAQSASLPPREPLTHFLGACQNLCWRLLRGLSVGVGGARTNTAGRQCVLSCAFAYSRVRRGARQRETDNGILLREVWSTIWSYSIIFT